MNNAIKLMLPGSALNVSLLVGLIIQPATNFWIQFTTLIPYPGNGFLEEYILLGDIVNLKI